MPCLALGAPILTIPQKNRTLPHYGIHLLLRTQMTIDLDFEFFRITVLLKSGYVVFMTKLSGETQTTTIPKFIKILERVSAYKKNNPLVNEKLKKRK